MAIIVRPMEEKDTQEAERIFRVAFSKILGLPDPDLFSPTCSVIAPRRRMHPEACFVAEKDGSLVGSNLAARWGSVGFFGPLTVQPELWDQGVGKHLLEPVMEAFSRWGVTHAGLFTFPQSPKHIGLYQKFGFWPGALTALFGKSLDASQPAGPEPLTFASLSETDRAAALPEIRAVTDAIYPGLDVSAEVRFVYENKLGETVLIREGGRVTGVGLCHFGPGSEGGSIACYVKFGAVAGGSGGEERFARLMRDCESLARLRKMPSLSAGVSLARKEAYQKMRELGFRAEFQGIAMHRPHDPAYHRPGVFVADDWR